MKTPNVANVCYIPSSLTTGVTSSVGWPHAQINLSVWSVSDFSFYSRVLMVALC